MSKRTKSVKQGGRSELKAAKAGAIEVGTSLGSTKPSQSLGSSNQSKATRAGTSSIVVGDASIIADDYRPSEAEPFMNGQQKAYFKRKLQAWREEILRQTRETLEGLTVETAQFADIADRATSETDRSLELRARDRQRKLIAKIDSALARIEDGSYGYCEDTGEPIGLRRLEARPIATLSLEAQERHERRERVHRDD